MNKYIYPILLAIFIFVYAYQHRYQHIGVAVMDTWRGVLLLPNDKGEYVVREQ